MAIRVALNHKTSYRYPRPVWLSPQILRLRPAPHCRTPVLSYSLTIKPAEHFINWQQDPYSNRLARLVFPKKTTELAVEVDLIADLTVINPFDFFLEKEAQRYPFIYPAVLARELQPYLEAEKPGEKLACFIAKSRVKDVPTVDFLVELNAWPEVYLPGAGWVGLDPTSGLLAGEGHLPLACSADPLTAAPVTGSFSHDDEEIAKTDPEDGAIHGDGESDNAGVFGFAMSIQRIHEDPRVTKPYTDEQWAQIEALGHQVVADLKRSDVRLTMGGEPTFVSIDDMDGPEWNSAALGPMKYKRGDELLRRLRDRFAPG